MDGVKAIIILEAKPAPRTSSTSQASFFITNTLYRETTTERQTTISNRSGIRLIGLEKEGFVPVSVMAPRRDPTKGSNFPVTGPNRPNTREKNRGKDAILRNTRFCFVAFAANNTSSPNTIKERLGFITKPNNVEENPISSLSKRDSATYPGN